MFGAIMQSSVFLSFNVFYKPADQDQSSCYDSGSKHWQTAPQPRRKNQDQDDDPTER